MKENKLKLERSDQETEICTSSGRDWNFFGGESIESGQAYRG